jgi:ribulose-phosphate 3-epimerase
VTPQPPRRTGDVQIAASILSADFSALGDAVRAVERGGADRIHVDVMDGRFVPPITIGSGVVEALRRVSSLPIDVHLMVDAPERHLDAFARAGASSLTVHVEATPHPHRALGAIRALGVQAGIALNPGTPADAIAELAEMLNQVLVMSVNPGYAGQAFIPSVLRKVSGIRGLVGRGVLIGIDGGISPQTAPAAVAAGVDVLIAASAIFQATEGIDAAIARLRAAAAP